jgi:hypothetical protein
MRSGEQQAIPRTELPALRRAVVRETSEVEQ